MAIIRNAMCGENRVYIRRFYESTHPNTLHWIVYVQISPIQFLASIQYNPNLVHELLKARKCYNNIIPFEWPSNGQMNQKTQINSNTTQTIMSNTMGLNNFIFIHFTLMWFGLVILFCSKKKCLELKMCETLGRKKKKRKENQQQQKTEKNLFTMHKHKHKHMVYVRHKIMLLIFILFDFSFKIEKLQIEILFLLLIAQTY